MFSYRHAFHAGNHADVLKHMVLVATLQHLTQKEAALTVLDTHAGAGLYRLDSEFAHTSGEAAQGIERLLSLPTADLAPAIQNYVEVVRTFNRGAGVKVYPGSPFIAQHLLRPHDRLKLFELHPTDQRLLGGNIAQLEAGRQVSVAAEDGFEAIKKFLPPPSRRALVLCDPSYEIKSDYHRVPALLQEALQRFATGCYAVWYPIIARPEAHDLPRRLKAQAVKAGKAWLHASLTVKGGQMQRSHDGVMRPSGLPASAMFLINPPYPLQPALQEALPQLVKLLGQDQHATFTLQAGQ